jgi:hypothetical protein
MRRISSKPGLLPTDLDVENASKLVIPRPSRVQLSIPLPLASTTCDNRASGHWYSYLPTVGLFIQADPTLRADFSLIDGSAALAFFVSLSLLPISNVLAAEPGYFQAIGNASSWSNSHLCGRKG